MNLILKGGKGKLFFILFNCFIWKIWYSYFTMKTFSPARDYQIYTKKTNGDEAIRAWFTYEQAEKKVEELMNKELYPREQLRK